MKYQLKNEILTITISDLGAEMQSLVKEGAEYLWNGDSRFWGEQSPVLFPYVGRFTEGKYYLKGKEFEMDIHGFARKCPFSLVEKTENSIWFEMTDNADTYEMYPYHFSLQIGYELKDNQVDVIYKVQNLSDETMYFGIGAHPGFNLPLEEGLDFSDYYLEFSGKSYPEQVGHTETCFLSSVNKRFPLENDKILSLSHDMFDEDAIVLQHVSDTVTLMSDRGKRKVKVVYPNMPYLGLWHAPKTEAPYICIEPWTSLPSRQGIIEEFSNKCDLIRLAADMVYENKWSIIIE